MPCPLVRGDVFTGITFARTNFDEYAVRAFVDLFFLIIYDAEIGIVETGFPRFVPTKKRQLSPQMVIQKLCGARIRQEEMDACEDFRRLKKLHERKMNKGYKRQHKKIRGSKVLL